MSYATTRKCDEDLVDIYVGGTGEFGPAQAERYHEGLIAMFALLAANPQMARERSEFSPSVRLHPYKSHLIGCRI